MAVCWHVVHDRLAQPRGCAKRSDAGSKKTLVVARTQG